MQVNFLHNSLINKAQWNIVVAATPLNELFNYTWYLDAVCENWYGIIVGNYETVLAFNNKKIFGLNGLHNPMFSPQCNVCGNLNNMQLLEQFIIRSFHTIKFTSNTAFNFKSIKIEHRQKQILRLSANYDFLSNAYGSNHKRNIKKSLSLITTNISPNFSDFANQISTHLKYSSINKESISILNNLYNVNEADLQHLIYVSKTTDNEIGATAYFIVYNNIVLYIKGVATPLGKKTGAMHHLFDVVIKHFANKNFILDFGGSFNKSLAQFNKGFGAIDKSYFFYTKNVSFSLPSFFKKYKIFFVKK